MAADTIFTYATDVVVATDAETLDVMPHCSDLCAGDTLRMLGLPDEEPDEWGAAYAYAMPYSEHETHTYLKCYACGARI